MNGSTTSMQSLFATLGDVCWFISAAMGTRVAKTVWDKNKSWSKTLFSGGHIFLTNDIVCMYARTETSCDPNSTYLSIYRVKPMYMGYENTQYWVYTYHPTSALAVDRCSDSFLKTQWRWNVCMVTWASHRLEYRGCILEFVEWQMSWAQVTCEVTLEFRHNQCDLQEVRFQSFRYSTLKTTISYICQHIDCTRYIPLLIQ